VVAAAQADADIKNSFTNTTISKRCGDIHRWHKFLSQAEKWATPFSNRSQLKTDLEKAIISDVSSPSIGLTDLARRGKVRLATQPFAELSKTLHRTSKMEAIPTLSETEEGN